MVLFMNPEAFAAAVESEEREKVEAMIAGGLRDGLHWRDLEEHFTEAALAHCNDFGHSLIYVYKTGQFLELMSEDIEPFLLLPLARHLCYTTRDDLLPEFRDYAGSLADLAQPSGRDTGDLDRQELFPSSTREALTWILDGSSTHQALTLYDALLGALARNLLHFDTTYQSAFDRPVNDSASCCIPWASAWCTASTDCASFLAW